MLVCRGNAWREEDAGMLILIPLSILILIIVGIVYIYVLCSKEDDDLPSMRELWIEEREVYKERLRKERKRKWNSFLF